MAGRDDLIQQNITRARTQAEAPRAQEAEGKSALSSGSAPKSFLGGNYEVYSQLESIQFQGELGDASMRGNVAYIQIWKRGGTIGQDSPVQSLAGLNLDLVDFWGNLNSNISQTFGNFSSRLGINYSSNAAADAIFDLTAADANDLSQSFSFSSDSLIARQGSLALTTPTSATFDRNSLNVGTVRTQQESGVPQSSGALGTVRSANPNGFINALGRVGRAVAGIPQGKPIYSGQANAPRVDTSAALGSMRWQFLFNPSELELDVGPEFKSAETWGVSDKANSGQPLHWSHNKNAQLKFNSILLNGFVFGRKVEVLEQGLIELFMARDGAGQHGPHVLEFVWGNKVFGPCVIKNINIKEKMWDEGEVVNAELSFTLEQVPEWTINDGAYVDVARPGRRPLQEEASAAATGQQGPGANAGAGAEDEKTPPGGGATPDQKSGDQQRPPSTELYKKCQRAGVYADQFYQIESNGHLSNRPGVIRLRTSFSTLYPQAINELGASFSGLIKEPLTNPTDLYKSTELAIKKEDEKTFFKNYFNAGSFVKRAANSARIAAKTFSDSSQCKAERDKVSKITAQQKQKASCNAKRLGSSCSESGTREGVYVTTCSGIRLICARGFLRDPKNLTI